MSTDLMSAGVPTELKQWADSRAGDISLIASNTASISIDMGRISTNLATMAGYLSEVNATLSMINMNISNMETSLRIAAETAARPAVILNPEIYKDGDVWYAVYGSPDRGVVGMGDTPELAVQAFDEKWKKG